MCLNFVFERQQSSLFHFFFLSLFYFYLHGSFNFIFSSTSAKHVSEMLETVNQNFTCGFIILFSSCCSLTLVANQTAGDLFSIFPLEYDAMTITTMMTIMILVMITIIMTTITIMMLIMILVSITRIMFIIIVIITLKNLYYHHICYHSYRYHYNNNKQ